MHRRKVQFAAVLSMLPHCSASWRASAGQSVRSDGAHTFMSTSWNSYHVHPLTWACWHLLISESISAQWSGARSDYLTVPALLIEYKARADVFLVQIILTLIRLKKKKSTTNKMLLFIGLIFTASLNPLKSLVKTRTLLIVCSKVYVAETTALSWPVVVHLYLTPLVTHKDNNGLSVCVYRRRRWW